MRVIAKPKLIEFWESRKTVADRRVAERDLAAWYKITTGADWPNFGALRQTFGSADQVGNCVVFDVGNNRWRLIGRVMYHTRIVYVLKVMDHPEYDRGAWVDECGCRRPPPKRSALKNGTGPASPKRRG